MVNHQRPVAPIANQIDTQQLPGRVTRGVGAPLPPSVLVDDPLRVRVVGRVGAGRRTVARALHGAGIPVAGPGQNADADVDVYVFVETLNADDRAALAASVRPTVAVLNKSDLAGFGDGGPLAPVADRCHGLRRETGVPVRPLSALLAVAGTDPDVVDDAALTALQALATGAGLDEGSRRRLTADLDVLGTAVAVAALRHGAVRSAIAELLCGVSGIGDVLMEIDRAGAVVRYRRAVGRARIAAAVAVLGAAGAPAPDTANHLGQAIHWDRYARGPVSALHQTCARDASRGALRRWTQAGGRPAALP